MTGQIKAVLVIRHTCQSAISIRVESHQGIGTGDEKIISNVKFSSVQQQWPLDVSGKRDQKYTENHTVTMSYMISTDKKQKSNHSNHQPK